MTEINKADVYRKAAEVIVRDGKHEGNLTERGDHPWALRDPGFAVCALGACGRAEYELYGTLPVERGTDEYAEYGFTVTRPRAYGLGSYEQKIHYLNDDESTSAEDVALVLKRHAEEVDHA
ncbi:DUF6197 family protein [Streptomyces hydrogenans]|uniref:Uncharacterized protein n=1 Tax=Streptomyces hydrogenans TaxID=1873719 RepID=A0ABQ3PJI4_9ACTN|nr:hypothetical protein [Streptomyces hydrogenans]GHG10249.1 hypothetical protein GCM10018784_23710 [Streptomyces hydrogenans]GHI25177.1 hypothetical protein Shyd_65480 [Streptomyces hydrogenans]